MECYLPVSRRGIQLRHLGTAPFHTCGSGPPPCPYFLIGSALYLVGTILLTIAYHVPRNEALAAVEPHGTDAESHWTRYLSGWTAWNHVRAAASLAAAATLTVALHVG